MLHAQYHLPVIAAPKRQNSVTSGIILLNQKLWPRARIHGPPEPELYVTSNCRQTIYQMENYKYKEHKENRPISELPVKADDDHPDGLRYLALHLKYGIIQQDKPIPKTVSFNEYGLL